MMESIAKFYDSNEDLIIDMIQSALLAFFVIIMSAFLSRVVRRVVNRAVMKLSHGDGIVAHLLSQVAAYTVYLIAAVIVLDLFGVNTTSLITLVGAAGLAIGLALKDTLSNIAAGIMILFLRPIRKGEFVEFGSESGSVIDIGLFTSIFQTADGIYISSPNKTVWNSTIKNFSRNDKRRISVIVGIAYGDSIDVGMKVLNDIALSQNSILTDPEPQVVVYMLADSSVNLQLRAWCTTDKYWDTYWAVLKEVKLRIEAAGLSIPFPQQDVHIISH